MRLKAASRSWRSSETSSVAVSRIASAFRLWPGGPRGGMRTAIRRMTSSWRIKTAGVVAEAWRI